MLDDLVDHPDHRGLARQILEVLDIVLRYFAEPGGEVLLLGLVLALRVEAVQSQLDLRGQTDGARHWFADGQGHRIQGKGIGRVRHDDDKLRLVLPQREHPRVLEKTQAQGLRRYRQLRVVRRLRQWDVQNLGKRLRQVPLRDQTQASQHAQDRIAALLDQPAGSGQVRAPELAALPEEGEDVRLD